MTEQSIPCPSCGNQILFDVQQLLMGAAFTCPSCETKLSLANNSSRETFGDTLDQFEKLKKNVEPKKPS